jgi:hypothetical protein
MVLVIRQERGALMRMRNPKMVLLSMEGCIFLARPLTTPEFGVLLGH